VEIGAEGSFVGSFAWSGAVMDGSFVSASMSCAFASPRERRKAIKAHNRSSTSVSSSMRLSSHTTTGFMNSISSVNL
jgi:hypothetical protein